MHIKQRSRLRNPDACIITLFVQNKMRPRHEGKRVRDVISAQRRWWLESLFLRLAPRRRYRRYDEPIPFAPNGFQKM